MMNIGTIVYTLFSRFILLIILCVLAIPGLILLYVVPQKYRYNRCYFLVMSVAYYIVIKASLLPFTIIGKESLPAGPAIYIANHSSSLDIPVLGMLLGRKPHVWIAMRWLTRFWCFRLLLPRMAILVDMDHPQSNVRSIIKIMQLAKEQAMNIMIFPEGQRYTDGKIHSFFGGFVLLAKKLGYPIVPIRIFNLEKVYPPETFWIHYGEVKVVIGQPMQIQNDESDELFQERVYTWFVNQEQ